jgi:hypothetical protein
MNKKRDFIKNIKLIKLNCIKAYDTPLITKTKLQLSIAPN